MDANAVAVVLRALAFGLPAFVMIKVLLPAFHGPRGHEGAAGRGAVGRDRERRRRAGAAAASGAVAAAIGVSCSAVVNAGLLYVMLLRRGRFRLDALARTRLPRVLRPAR